MTKILRYIVFTFTFLCTIMGAKAETVSQKEASRLAQIFFNAVNERVTSKPNLVYNGRNLTTDRLFVPFYVYNLPTGGFVIISAENKAFPILGFSIKDNFDPNNADESLMVLLKNYAGDIEMIRYDSQITPEAEKSWQDFNGYVGKIISSVYDATDVIMAEEEVKEVVENFVTTDRLEELSSDIYTPDQWIELVNQELNGSKSFVAGIVGTKSIEPVVVHGRKGDYYRISKGEGDSNNRLMRLTATELYGDGMIADLSGVDYDYIREIEEDEVPFALFNDFIAETMSEAAAREDMFSEKVNPTKPIIRPVGGGHYEIKLPEQIEKTMIYNLNGSVLKQYKYGNTDTAVISLEGYPYGFYFAQLQGKSGQTYGFKLLR